MCEAPHEGRLETWINEPIQEMCAALSARGLAHSIEAWRGGQLVGGLYGIAIGAAFFGESMFSTERDASKVALTHLVARLKAGRLRFLDKQFLTEHLASFGAEEIPRAEYARRLAAAIDARADFWAAGTQPGGAWSVQAINQAS